MNHEGLQTKAFCPSVCCCYYNIIEVFVSTYNNDDGCDNAYEIITKLMCSAILLTADHIHTINVMHTTQVITQLYTTYIINF